MIYRFTFQMQIQHRRYGTASYANPSYSFDQDRLLGEDSPHRPGDLGDGEGACQSQTKAATWNHLTVHIDKVDGRAPAT